MAVMKRILPFTQSSSSFNCKKSFSGKSFEGLHNVQIRESVELQTVFVMSDKEIYRDLTMPDNQRLKERDTMD